jgi:hypothetical protein
LYALSSFTHWFFARKHIMEYLASPHGEAFVGV